MSDFECACYVTELGGNVRSKGEEVLCCFAADEALAPKVNTRSVCLCEVSVESCECAVAEALESLSAPFNNCACSPDTSLVGRDKGRVVSEPVCVPDSMFDEAVAPGDLDNDSFTTDVAFNLAVAVNVNEVAMVVVCRYTGVVVDDVAVGVSY